MIEIFLYKNVCLKFVDCHSNTLLALQGLVRNAYMRGITGTLEGFDLYNLVFLEYYHCDPDLFFKTVSA